VKHHAHKPDSIFAAHLVKPQNSPRSHLVAAVVRRRKLNDRGEEDSQKQTKNTKNFPEPKPIHEIRAIRGQKSPLRPKNLTISAFFPDKAAMAAKAGGQNFGNA
jgi:hypothetical protein